MKYIYPDFYNDFSCTGSACLECCCGGWVVFIDEDTYKMYSELEEPKRSMVCSHIEELNVDGETRYAIKMNEKGYCPFLNEEKLCGLYSLLSPDALSEVCDTYPRKYVAYYDVWLATVKVSCSEVARILVEKREPISFGFAEDETITDTTNADWMLYNELINGLVLTTNILQNREYPLEKRIQLVIDLTEVIQQHIDNAELVNLRDNIECYRNSEYCQNRMEILEEKYTDKLQHWSAIQTILEAVNSVGESLAHRKAFLKKYQGIEMNEALYQIWSERFKKYENEIELENLAVAFIFEYYMDALKGKDLVMNATKMLLLLVMIRACEIMEYNMQGELEIESKILLISRISKLMEHTVLLNMVVENLIKNNGKKILYELTYLLK